MSERERNFSVVTKTIRIRGDIEDLLYRLVCEHQKKYRELPQGLLLGPNEWMEFELSSRRRYHFSSSGGHSFHGVPLHPKTRPGVDLIPSESVVRYLAKGIAKEELKEDLDDN